MSELNEHKEEIICQKAILSSFELHKLVSKSKNLSNYIKNNNDGIMPVSIKAVLSNLCTFYNPEKNCIFPKISDIAEETCLSKCSVMRIVELLHHSGLVLRQEKLGKDNRRNFYAFTGKFWELVLPEVEKFFNKKKVAVCNVKNTDRSQPDTFPIYKQITDLKNNEKDFFQKKFKNDSKPSENILNHSERIKTEFQKEFSDVIERLTPYEWEKYQKIEGFEKREWLRDKRKAFIKAAETADFHKKSQIDANSGGSPLDLTREKALAFIYNFKNVPKRKQPLIINELIQKHNFTDDELKPESG